MGRKSFCYFITNMLIEKSPDRSLAMRNAKKGYRSAVERAEEEVPIKPSVPAIRNNVIATNTTKFQHTSFVVINKRIFPLMGSSIRIETRTKSMHPKSLNPCVQSRHISC